MEDMHNQVAEIEQDPTSLSATLAAECLRTGGVQLVLDLTGDSLHVALGSAADQQEDIGKGQRARDIQRDQIFARFRVCRCRGDLEEFASVLGCCHTVTA
jgi:hypothetical protein